MEQPSEAKEQACVPLLSVCLGFLGREMETEKIDKHHFQQHVSMNLTVKELNRQKTEGSSLKFNNFYGFVSQF